MGCPAEFERGCTAHGMALLEPAQWFCELRLLGLVCEKDRTQGTLDA